MRKKRTADSEDLQVKNSQPHAHPTTKHARQGMRTDGSKSAVCAVRAQTQTLKSYTFRYPKIPDFVNNWKI